MLALREFHQGLGGRFTTVNGEQVVEHYGDVLLEHGALRENVSVLDFGFRSRLCLTGADRVRFLNGQVTNDVKKLCVGEGCYAALVTAKGKMVSDLNIFSLQDELLLDFEPGLTPTVSERLEKHIVADDVQVVDVAPHYGLLSLQGPKAEAVVNALGLFTQLPAEEFQSVKVSDATLGEIYMVNQPRLVPSRQEPLKMPPDCGLRESSAAVETSPATESARGLVQSKTQAPRERKSGFDLFIPLNSLAAIADKLIAAAKAVGGSACGWTAFETARIEAGIPRFGVDMDETNIPLECGIEARAVSYNKGCYVGQEVINRIHSIGHVNRELVGLRLADDLETLPVKGDRVLHAGKEVGYITSAVASPTLKANLALGYVRREVNVLETELRCCLAAGESLARVVALPFGK